MKSPPWYCMPSLRTVLRVIAVRANCDPRTVAKYLRGMKTNRRNRKAIEKALADEGYGSMVRRPGLAKGRP